MPEAQQDGRSVAGSVVNRLPVRVPEERRLKLLATLDAFGLRRRPNSRPGGRAHPGAASGHRQRTNVGPYSGLESSSPTPDAHFVPSRPEA